MKSSSNRVPVRPLWHTPILLAGVLIFLVVAIYSRTAGHEFVNYDDDDYVYGNPVVTRGLSVAGTAWAFTHFHASNWHPLTWISHMLDCQVFGLWPGGHHLSNTVLHALAACALMAALRELTGSVYRSFWVALLFAVHPLRVESVAWVAERKDVLSGLFFFLTLWVYARGRKRPGRWVWMAGLPLCFIAALLSKPMVVTLPFVLLLLDFWPLGRLTGRKEIIAALREKIPLFVCTLAACLVTLWAQQGAIQTLDRIPPGDRLANVVISYVRYLGLLVWPADLAVFYPWPPHGYAWAMVAGSVVLLLAVSAGVWFLRQSHPYLTTGWLWYLGTLVPVVGFVQVGSQAYADRYTYLPHVGLLVMVVWWAGRLAADAATCRRVGWVVAGSVVLFLAILSWRQVSHWKDTETLWRRTLAVTRNNWLAHNNLGSYYLSRKDDARALAEFNEALQIRPAYPSALSNRGQARLGMAEPGPALRDFEEAKRLDPANAEVCMNLGVMYLYLGQVDRAIPHLAFAVRLAPSDARARNNLGQAFLRLGRYKEALVELRRAVEIQPGYAKAHNNLGSALFYLSQPREALRHFQEAVRLDPQDRQARENYEGLMKELKPGF